MKDFISRHVRAYVSSILGIGLICLFAADGGYAMQPPPPPLDVAQLKILIAKADLIIIGKIAGVQETEGTLEASLCIEKLLKGKADGKDIIIRETYKMAHPRTLSLEKKDEREPPSQMVRTTAGPGTYHGKYTEGSRIVVLLEKIKGTDHYMPMGSGTYNQYLCEFIIENDGIQSIEPNYFRFAEDMAEHTATERKFTRLIKKLIKTDFNTVGE